MKRLSVVLYCCLCLILMPLCAYAAPAWPSEVSIEADGGILMDADTGTVLYGKNMDQSYYPASITKILTALIVLENCSLDEMVEFSYDDVYNVEAGSSSAGIDEGDTLTVRDCLYALMLASANESANALARHVSGSREAFAELMNEKAASLGCTGSHFANPSGLNDENHYTTAYDMALITREAIKNPVFLEINGTRSYKLAPTKRSPEGGYVANHHRMLNKNESVYYPGAFAGKTGYTTRAGNTLVTCAREDGMTLIAVVLNGHKSHYSDTKALFDFGFGNFRSLKAADYETSYRSVENELSIGGMTTDDGLTLTLDTDGRVIIPKEASFSDVTSTLSYELTGDEPADVIAAIHYTYNDYPVGSVYLRCPGLLSMTDTDISLLTEESTAPETIAPVYTTAISSPLISSGNDVPVPTNLKPVFIIILAVILVIGIASAVLIYFKKKEEADLLMRHQRRLDRLEDMGFSASDFDKLVAKRRSSSPSAAPTSGRRRSRKRKSFFSR